jgi:fibronectin-binding autotransporter adhesin
MVGGRFLRVSITIGVLVLVAGLVGQSTSAATYTWANTGATWNTAANWGGTVPGSSDVGLFNLGSYSFQPTLSAITSVGGLWDTGTGAVTVSGSALTLNSASINGNATTGIELDPGAGALTISSSLVLGGAQSWLNNAAGSSPLTVTGNVATAGNLLTVAGSGTSSFSGVISGTGGLTMNGPGFLGLSGINTFTGATTVGGGTVQLNTANGANGGLASPTVAVTGGGFLALNAADVLGYTLNRNVINISDGTVSNITSASRVTIENTVTMTGGVLTGTGVGDANGAYSLNMATTGNAFTATSDAAGNPAIISAKSISLQSGNATFNVTRGAASPATDLLVTAAITPYSGNASGIIKAGNGIMTLAASSNYTGGTTINAGEVLANAVSALGSGPATISGGTLALNTTAAAAGNTVSIGGGLLSFQSLTAASVGGLSGTGNLSLANTGGSAVALTVGSNGAITTYNGNLSGTGASLTISGGGLTLAGTSNTYTGATTVQSGGIGFSSTSSFPSGGAATVSIANGAAIGGSAYPTITSWLANIGAFSMSPSAAVAITGNSSESITWPAGTLSLGSIGNNTFSGTLTPSGSNYYLGGGIGTLSVANVGGLIDGTGPRKVVINAGAGSVSLLGTNTYTGGTTVVGGTLKLANTASALGSSGAVTIANGGALDANGQLIQGATPYTFTISGTGAGGGGAIINSSASQGWLKSVTLAGNATIYAGSGVGLIGIGSTTAQDGTLNLAGYTLTKNGPGTLALNGLSYSGAGNIVVNQGALQFVSNYNTPSQQPLALTGTGTITINPGGLVTMQNYNETGSNFNITMPIALSGGTLGSAYPGPHGATIASPINVTTNSTLYFSGGYGNVTLSGNISGVGGLTISADGTNATTITGSNSYAGGSTVILGTVTVQNNQSAANGGWTIGATSGNATDVVNFQAGSTVAVAAANQIQIGQNIGSGNTSSPTLNAAGTVNNSGGLFIGRTGILNVNSGAVWNQGGSFTVSGEGGYTATMNVNAGGLVNYTGTGAITVNPGAGSSGSGNLFVNGGTLETAGAFQTSATGTGSYFTELQNGGVLLLSASQADLTPGTPPYKTQFVLGAGGGIINTNGFNAGLSQTITGAGGLTKTGNGTLTLLGANTYTGVTLVGGGVLTLGNSAALAGSTLDTGGSGLLNVSAWTSLPLGGLQGAGNFVMANTAGTAMPLTVGSNGSSTQFWGSLSDAGLGVAFTKVGAGTLILSGSNTYSGGTNINAGTLVFANSAALPASGAVAVANGAVLGGGWAFGQSFLSGIAAASLSNTFTVALGTSNGNTLDFSSASGANLANASLGAYANSVFTGTLIPNNGTYRLGGGGAALTFNSQLTGSNALVVNGPGTVVLFSGNSYTGGTTLTGGLLNINDDTALGTAPASPGTNITFAASATLQSGISGLTLSANRGIVLANGAAATFDTNGNGLTIGGTISGSGSITAIGNSTLTLANTESYSGSTTVSGAQLTLDFTQPTSPTNNIVPSGSALTLAAGTLNMLGNSATANSQQFNGTLLSSGADAINTSGGTTNIALGAVSRSIGTALNITLPVLGSITTTTSNANANGIFGGYAVTGGSTWAVASGTSPYTLSGLAAGSYNSSFTAGANVDTAAGGALALGSGTTAINSLRFSYAGSASLSLGTTNTLAISTGGLLASPTVGANAVTITGGTIMGPANSDFVVNQYNTSSSLTINSSLVNSSTASTTGLTKAGPGTLVLTASNYLSGPVAVVGGVLSVVSTGSGTNSADYLTSASSVTVQNATLQLYHFPAGGGYPTNTYHLNNLTLNNSTLNLYSTNFNAGGAGVSLPNKVTVLNNVTVNLSGGGYEQAGYFNGGMAGSGTLNVNTSTAAYSNGEVFLIQGDTSGFSGTLNAGNNLGGISIEALHGWGVGATLIDGSGIVWVNNSGAKDPISGNYAQTVVTTNVNEPTSKLVVNTGGTFNSSVSVAVGSLNGNGGTINLPAGYVLSAGALGTTDAFAGVIAGSGGFTKTGAGLMNLSGLNTYPGGTTISGGILQLGGFNALGASSGSLGIGLNSVLDLNGNSPTVGAVTLTNGSIISSNGGSPTLTGASFNLQGGVIGVSLAGGATTVSAGTVQLLAGASLPVNGSLTANSGVLDLGGNSPTLGQLSGIAGVITDNSAGGGTTTLSVTGGNFSGSIRNGANQTVALSLAAPGTLVLGGSNTYHGTTSVDFGTLVVNGTHNGGDAYSIGALGSGGTLSGAGTISGTNTVTLYNGATISPGPGAAPGSIGTLTLPSLTSNGAVTANFDLSGTTTAGGGVNDLIAVTGNLNLTGPTAVEINSTAGTLASGTPYTLFTYGTLNPASTSSLTLAPGVLGPRQTAVFNYGSLTNSAIEVTINGFNANLVWVGTSSTTWDQNDTSNLPWTGAPTSAGNFFASRDNVTFNNKAAATTVTIATTVNPGSVTVTGTKNFVFTGGGDISDGTSLKVLGPGTLTIGTNNEYTLGTYVQGGGSIILAVDNGLPQTGTVTLGSSGSNGTLDLAGYSQTVGALAVGAGATSAGQVITASTGSSTLTYNGAGVSSFAGTIQDTAATTGGTLSLVVASGLLNLGGNNTFSGETTLAGGTLQTGAPLALQNTVLMPAGGALDLGGLNAIVGGLTGDGTLSPTNGTLTVGGNGLSSEFDGILSGSFALGKVGSGTFTLTGQNSYTGGTTIAGGVLSFTASGLGTVGSVTMSGGTLQWASGNTTDLSPRLILADGAIAGVDTNGNTLTFGSSLGLGPAKTGGLSIGGAGMLSINANNTYTGPTTVTAGTLAVGVIGTTAATTDFLQSSSTVSVQNSTLQLYDIPRDGGYPSNTYHLNNLTLNNATLNLTGGNAYPGGAAEILPDMVTILGTVALNKSGGSYEHAGYFNGGMAGTGTLDVSTVSDQVFILQGDTSGFSGTLDNITTTGGISIEAKHGWGVGATLVVNGLVWVNDASGTDPVGGNYVQTPVTTNVNEPTSMLVVNPGGSFNTSVGITVGSLNGTGGTVNMPSGKTLTTGALGTTDNFAGVIAGAASFVKAGTGTMTLSGANTYSNGTFVNGGELQLGNPSALGTGGLAANGGTLDLEGYSVTVPSFSGAAGTVTDYGLGGGVTTLTVSQSNTTSFGGTIADGPSNILSLALTGPGTLILTGTNTYSGGTSVQDGILIAGSPTALPNGSSLTVGQGASSLFSPVAGPAVAAPAAEVVAVPEPSTLVLVLVGVAAGLALRRRRQG